MFDTYAFHGDDVPPSSFEEALFHILPVPLEQTVSYGGGTAAGPQAILAASCQLELFDGLTVPADYGIYTALALNCERAITEVIEELAAATFRSAAARAIPVTLGGEHSLTHGCIAGLKRQHGHDFGVISFDAHADLRDSYEGSRQSHASVMRRIHEEGIPILQIGTRSYCLEEHTFRQQHKVPYFDAQTIWRNGTSICKLPSTFPDKVYISFDVDCFDTSLMPATGTPVPGGLNWHQAVTILETLLSDRICVGFDLVELAPIEGLHGADFAVAQLVYTIMGLITRSEPNRHFHDLDVRGTHR